MLEQKINHKTQSAKLFRIYEKKVKKEKNRLADIWI